MSKYTIQGCFDSCDVTKDELKDSLSELISYIGEDFDFSVLAHNAPLLSVFCAFPDLIGEVCCDASTCAILSRSEFFIKKRIDVLEPIINAETVKKLKNGINNWLSSKCFNRY